MNVDEPTPPRIVWLPNIDSFAVERDGYWYALRRMVCIGDLPDGAVDLMPDEQIIALAAEVERLRAIAARAQGVITDGGPDETPTARYILNGRN